MEGQGFRHVRTEIATLGDVDARGFETCDLRIRGVVRTADDRSGVAHPFSGRRRTTGDEPCDRLLHVVTNPVGGFGFIGATDLTDHDDAVGGVIFVEHRQQFDEVEPLDGIPADADARGLSDASFGALPDGFVGEGAGTTDDADRLSGRRVLRGHVDVAGHDADLASTREGGGGPYPRLDVRCVMIPGQLGPISTSPEVPSRSDLHHVRGRNPP